MGPSEKDKAIIDAISEMSCLRYFPADAGARAAIAKMLDRMARNAAEIRWLTSTMVDQVGEWQGPKELRGIFCQRFAPADGIEASSTHPKFSPEANETRAIEAHQQVKQLSAPVEVLTLVKAKGMPR